MTDTHSHLYLSEFEEPGRPTGSSAVERAVAAGVNRIVMPNVNEQTMAPMLELARAYPEVCTFALGLHPTELTADWLTEINKIESALPDSGAVAIGEIGMDLYWDKQWRDAQAQAFDYQLHLAEDMSLPAIIHCREALDEILWVLKNHSGSLPPCIFHCFTSSRKEVEAIRGVVDARFGIGGVVTFKNAGALREALPAIGIDRILLETDSPYLAPVPMRGKRNESSFLPHVLNCIASELKIPPGQAEEITDANAQSLGLCFR